MGNSQSIEKVGQAIKTGVDIYKTVKGQQDKLNHEQQQFHNPNNHVTASHHISYDVDDDEEYIRLRALAHEEAEKRNSCYAKSQEAYKNGDGAEAKELSNRGHEHDALMKKYNKQAADHIFAVKNQGRPANEIDLHGLFVKEASDKVEEAIQHCQQIGAKDLIIIVGKGLHSPGQIAKLKPAIIELVKKYKVTCQPNIPNPGCLYVEFGKGTGDLSWLDQITDKLDDQCVIM
ncbi:hypothetical protein BDF20DRAFT_814986 [Mycotypha africana]|uniref:uncharacterized protein n=1 Tax=Mycotypha africana TaxID=64632 RepID=UPI00230042EC|nr:uncharacterized protein BDF20DRAFT_814986 [Mycotypha africana]KAI8987677.1 hypothetical protein BDF20DRAFT_814986 [Mycotypha africana]